MVEIHRLSRLCDHVLWPQQGPVWFARRIRRRSNCASAEKMFSNSSLDADVVSIIPSEIERNPIPRSFSFSIMFTRCRMESPSRSKRHTTNVSSLCRDSLRGPDLADLPSRRDLIAEKELFLNFMRQKRVNLKIKFLFVGTDSRVTNRSSTLSVNHRRLQTDLPPAADQRQDDAINRFRTLSMQYPELLCVENSFTNPSINRWFCAGP